MKRGLSRLLSLTMLVGLAVTASAQDNSVAYFHLGPTNSMAKSPLEQKPAPQMILGTNTQVTGLVVDLIKPKQMWRMMNPTNTAPRPLDSVPRFEPPVQNSPTFNDNLAVHEPDFALIRFHFLSTPQPPAPPAKK